MEFDVHLPSEPDQMLSRLEEISLLHAVPYIVDGKPVVFSNRVFRIAAGQWPYEVCESSIPGKGQNIDTGALQTLVEQHYAATVLHYRENVDATPHSYFLPPACTDDPYRRVLYVPDRDLQSLLAAYR